MTLLDGPADRSVALHQLVLTDFADESGNAYWIDARNNATTYAFYELAGDRTDLSGLRIARAFTAYQHHSLVRRTARVVTPNTAAVAVPCLPSLYRDDDVPDHEAADLLESALAILAELAETLDIPVVITANTGSDHGELVAEYVDHEINCRKTGLGLQYSSEDFTTDVYWHDGFWQTTIPYWVDLFGAVSETDTVRPRPETPITELEVV